MYVFAVFQLKIKSLPKIKTLDLRKMECMLNQKLYPEIKCTTSWNVQSDKN